MIGQVSKITPSFYGFIIDEKGIMYFFHGTQYTGDWEYLKRISPPNTKIGPQVQFKAIDHEKGPRAINVELL